MAHRNSSSWRLAYAAEETIRYRNYSPAPASRTVLRQTGPSESLLLEISTEENQMKKLSLHRTEHEPTAQRDPEPRRANAGLRHQLGDPQTH